MVQAAKGALPSFHSIWTPEATGTLLAANEKNAIKNGTAGRAGCLEEGCAWDRNSRI